MRDLETIPLRKLVDLALASDRMTAGRYLHEIKQRLPVLEAAMRLADLGNNYLTERQRLNTTYCAYEQFADAGDAYSAAKNARINKC